MFGVKKTVVVAVLVICVSFSASGVERIDKTTIIDSYSDWRDGDGNNVDYSDSISTPAVAVTNQDTTQTVPSDDRGGVVGGVIGFSSTGSDYQYVDRLADSIHRADSGWAHQEVENIGSYTAAPSGVWTDGTDVYVTGVNGSKNAVFHFTRSGSTYTFQDWYDTGVSYSSDDYLAGIEKKGGDFYAVRRGESTDLHRLDASNFSSMETYDLTTNYPTGIEWTGEYWIITTRTNDFIKVYNEEFEELLSYDASGDGFSQGPSGVAAQISGGNDYWVGDSGSETARLYKVTAGSPASYTQEIDIEPDYVSVLYKVRKSGGATVTLEFSNDEFDSIEEKRVLRGSGDYSIDGSYEDARIKVSLPAGASVNEVELDWKQERGQSRSARAGAFGRILGFFDAVAAVPARIGSFFSLG